MNEFLNKIKKNAYKALTPLISILQKTRITPNGIITIGFIITILK